MLRQENSNYRRKTDCCSIRNTAGRCWMNCANGWRLSLRSKTEPNSGLGKAISYLQRHWTKLTLFLRQPGAPLDNNIAERTLKKAILHRKNALFYKTMNGARVGDLFMSLIHTCEREQGQPVRLPDGVAPASCGNEGESGGVDAVELPDDAGRYRDTGGRLTFL